jgi:hypothetical protein
MPAMISAAPLVFIARTISAERRLLLWGVTLRSRDSDARRGNERIQDADGWKRRRQGDEEKR